MAENKVNKPQHEEEKKKKNGIALWWNNLGKGGRIGLSILAGAAVITAVVVPTVLSIKKTVKVASIEISCTKDAKTNERLLLSAKVLPENATNKELKWSTEGDGAIVEENGKIYLHAHSAGEVKVIATAKDGSEVSSNEKVKFTDPSPTEDSYFVFDEIHDWSVEPYPVIAYSVYLDSEKEVPVNLVIPALHENKPIIGISNLDCLNKDKLESIVIPSSIEWIGNEYNFSNIFREIQTLKRFIVDKENTNFSTNAAQSILFNKDKTTLYAYPSANGAIDFSEFTNLKTIGDASLLNTEATSITIHEGVSTIQNSAFGHCSNLEYVKIPSTITSIGDAVFARDNKLVKFDLSKDNTKYITKENDAALFNSSLTWLIAYPSCNGECNLSVYEGLKCIKGSAFENSNISKVTFGDKIECILDNAFKDCKNLKNISMPKYFTFFGYESFLGSGLTSATVADPTLWKQETEENMCKSDYVANKLATEKDLCLSKNDGFDVSFEFVGDEEKECKVKFKDADDYYRKSIYFPKFEGIYDYDSEIDNRRIVTEIASDCLNTSGGERYIKSGSYKTFYFPDSIKKINDDAFNMKSGWKMHGSLFKIQNIVFNDELEIIGKNAFSGIEYLKDADDVTINIPANVKEIGIGAFKPYQGDQTLFNVKFLDTTHTIWEKFDSDGISHGDWNIQGKTTQEIANALQDIDGSDKVAAYKLVKKTS